MVGHARFDERVLQVLLDDAHVECARVTRPTHGHASVMSCAAQMGAPACVALLLARGVPLDPEALGACAHLPLAGDRSSLELLLRAGADPNYRRPGSGTASR